MIWAVPVWLALLSESIPQVMTFLASSAHMKCHIANCALQFAIRKLFDSYQHQEPL